MGNAQAFLFMGGARKASTSVSYEGELYLHFNRTAVLGSCEHVDGHQVNMLSSHYLGNVAEFIIPVPGPACERGKNRVEIARAEGPANFTRYFIRLRCA